MAFTITSITGWVNENNISVLSAAVLEPKALQGFTPMAGVKYKSAIKFLDVTAPLQPYAACTAFATTGTTTLTDKDITVINLMNSECLDVETLNLTAFQLGMKPGMNEDFPFEQEYAKLKISKIQKQLEEYAFSTSSGTTGIPAGILSIAGADADVNDRTFVWSATTWTASDYINEVFGMLGALPDDINNFDDLTLFVPYTISRKMLQAFVAGSIVYMTDFADPKYNGGNNPWIFPGTNITVFPTQVPANNAILTPASNLIKAFDLQSDFDSVKLYWDDNTDGLNWKIKFRIGFNYYFGDYITWSR